MALRGSGRQGHGGLKDPGRQRHGGHEDPGRQGHGGLRDLPCAASLTPGAQGVATAVVGSNGWALGRDATRTGNAMVLANPHLPWAVGHFRFYQVQLTIHGTLDVSGADLYGTPLAEIGHTPFWASCAARKGTARRPSADLLRRGSYRLGPALGRGDSLCRSGLFKGSAAPGHRSFGEAATRLPPPSLRPPLTPYWRHERRRQEHSGRGTCGDQASRPGPGPSTALLLRAARSGARR
ncbi:penicillin acylase family protein [Streptomyces mirabilis]|uniref:penicillin acylase family protein n=1 Tax=Streptomyces mirabilis TaxID=68239 RepID=UPI0036440767